MILSVLKGPNPVPQRNHHQESLCHDLTLRPSPHGDISNTPSWTLLRGPPGKVSSTRLALQKRHSQSQADLLRLFLQDPLPGSRVEVHIPGSPSPRLVPPRSLSKARPRGSRCQGFLLEGSPLTLAQFRFNQGQISRALFQ